ncbi:MAG: hypothetical protein ACI91B_005014, partial [Planctomycetota bacterium]
GDWNEELEGILNSYAGILGIEIDLDAIKANRPKAATLLRKYGAKSGK